jgi:hypothetical protein
MMAKPFPACPVFWSIPGLAMLLLAAPARAQRIDLQPVGTYSLVLESRSGSFGACELSMIDRSPLIPLFPAEDRRLTPQRAMAGFFNFFRPGADPFPCNHFTARSWAGVLRFGLDAAPDRALWRDRPFTLVALQLEEALPVRREGVINRSPCPASGGCLRSTEASCRFRVGLDDGAPTPSPLGIGLEERRLGRSFLPATLASQPRAIEVTGTGERSRPITIDVTREFRRAMREGRDLQFVIYAEDAGLRTNDFGNDCRVFFGGRLVGGVSG